MAKPISSRFEKTTCQVDGKEHPSIDEVPAKHRSTVEEIGEPPPKESQMAMNRGNYSFSSLAEKTKDPNQKKFLRELVLPNLHLMDEKAKSDLFRELYKTPAGPMRFAFRLHPLFWVALGIGIPVLLAILFGR